MDAPTTPAKPKRGLPLALVPLALTYLAIAVNMTIAAIALPTISTEFAASASELAWVVGVTPMISAAFLLFGGSWSDRYGRKKLLQIGVVVFLIAAVLSGFAGSIEQLIALRALTGLGSALAMPAALALVFEVTTGAAQRTAVGIMGGTQAVGALLGPLLGGATLVAFGWQAAFWAVVPMLLLALVLNAFTLPADGSRSSHSLDVPAATLAAVVGVTFLYAASLAGPPNEVELWVALGIGIAALVGLVWWERRSDDPLFVGSLLRRRSFLVPTAAVVIVQFALGGLLFLNTQYVQLVLGFSALGAGLFLMPALTMWTVSAATAGVSSARFGARTVVVVASLVSAVGLLLIAAGGTDPAYPVLVIGLVLFGALGVVPALMTHAAVSNYGADRRSVGSSINSMAMRYGLAFGVTVLGALHAAVYRRELLASPPGQAVEESSDAAASLGGAVQVGEQVPGLLSAAEQAFASGYAVVLLIAAGLTVAMAAMVWRFADVAPATAHPAGEASTAAKTEGSGTT